MSFTLAQMKTAIQDYTDNTETLFVSHLPDFIKASEERIFKSVDLDVFRKNVTSAVSLNDKFLSLPTDYLSSFSLQITTAGSEDFLLHKDVNFLQEAYNGSVSTAKPRYYAQFDISNFIVAPTPDANYTVELHYYYRPASLSAGADSGTTWLSTNAPYALLFGSLVDAYIFMKGESDLIQQYEKRFMDQLTRLKDYGEARENSDAYVDGLPRSPRT
mgnify:FL=1|jgi:hypothetical protein|tara:strand:+ start:4232 stop:4879 length:648 start_codon:yes stop_codon:yes gene_type:complete